MSVDWNMRRGVRQGGYSLIELAVVLLIVGLLGVATWRFLPNIEQVLGMHASQNRLTVAEDSLLGFARLHGRLPCPDVTGDGREDCSYGGKIITRGQLPTSDLGLSPDDRSILYGVSRVSNADPSKDADLGAKLNRYQPMMPTGQDLSINLNGLDLCAGLRDLNQHPGSAIDVGSGATAMPVAIALADPGMDHKFNGLNATGFALPMQAHSPQYDDLVIALGVSQLMGRLDCASTMSSVQGAVHAAYAAYDVKLYAIQYSDFRTFLQAVAQSAVQDATVALGLAVADLAIGIANGTTAIGLAFVTEGIEAPLVVMTAADIVSAIASLAATIADLDSANADLVVANAEAAAATAYLTDMSNKYSAEKLKASRADTGGLIP